MKIKEFQFYGQKKKETIECCSLKLIKKMKLEFKILKAILKKDNFMLINKTKNQLF